jgi:hypothetical protein
MSVREELSEILARLEGEAVRVSFVDGDIYDVQIKSAATVKDKGSFDTEIIWAVSSSKPEYFDTGAKVELNVDEVAKVEILKNAQCVFERSPTDNPPLSETASPT